MVSLCLYVVAALISTAAAAPQEPATPQERISPCPELFRYETLDQADQWTGNLLIRSEDDLHGVWIRLIFDNPVKEIVTDGDYGVVLGVGDNQVLLKNKDFLLTAATPANIKITVKYAGSKFPQLIGYRLNAKTQCPYPDTQRTDFFQGDEHSKEFLTGIVSPISPPIDQSAYKCGLKPSIESPTSHLPWSADLFIRDKGSETYACEATLISPSHLVTAAHCVIFTKEKIKVPPSHLVLYLVEGSEKIESRNISKIHVHPAYDPSTLFNDIAILKVNKPLEINDNIRPICLGQEGAKNELTLGGYEIEKDGKISSKQKETRVKKLDQSECREKAPKLKNVLGEETSCFTYVPDNSFCVGDSGSSLVTYQDNVATLRGLVKVGILLQNKSECDGNSAVLVTSIENHLNWIARALQ